MAVKETMRSVFIRNIKAGAVFTSKSGDVLKDVDTIIYRSRKDGMVVVDRELI